MIGSGVNGYLQTGTSRGFARGLVAGLIPGDLGFSYAYNNNVYSNIGIGILRDGLRGAVVAGNRNGFGRGIAYSQLPNLLGHTVGLLSTGSLPTFQAGDGVFLYSGNYWSEKGAITFGNVISGSKAGLFKEDETGFRMYDHELDHYKNFGEQALGGLYPIAHALDLLLGRLGNAVGMGCSGYVLENGMQKYPYSQYFPHICK